MDNGRGGGGDCSKQLHLLLGYSVCLCITKSNPVVE